MGQYLNELYDRNRILECENKALRERIAAFESGERYLKLQEDHRKVQSGYQREINNLKRELDAAHKTTTNVRDIWFEQCDTDWDQYQAAMEKKDEEICKLKEQMLQMQINSDNKLMETKAYYEGKLKEKDEEIDKQKAIVQELSVELAHANALLNRDGTNAGIPTSQTPRGKNKRIPNSRKPSGNPKGGQEGHEKNTLEPPQEDEITDTETYEIGDNEICPKCGSQEFEFTGETEKYYEFNVKIKVIKKLHEVYLYRCLQCGELVKSADSPDLRSQCFYGADVQAIALSLMNTANSSMNKVALLLAGLSGDEVTPCEGYIAKLQSRAARNLLPFYNEVREMLIMLRLLYWDDTVISIDTHRACFRFYGDETLAFYVAHMKKDLKGVLEDNILSRLTGETCVMHDHNSINYNKSFHFTNLECDQHGERDCKKNSDDTGHQWSTDMKEHFALTIRDRNVLAASGATCFDDDYIRKFYLKYDEILLHGWQEYEADKERLKKYGAPFEKALLTRLEEYRENYFAWLKEFSLPTTNNLSERSLRAVKSKMKISGQFESEEAAQWYAIIRTYIETCRRCHVNEVEALTRLCEGNPYTLKELLAIAKRYGCEMD